MTSARTAYVGARIFDGKRFHDDKALLVEDRRISGIFPSDEIGISDVVELEGGFLVPGFVDLQVNGGGGVMFNDAPTVATLATISAAHASIGATTILPTLITDTPETVRKAIKATVLAIDAGIPGIAGLHLEGPHLSTARKGAHASALIRPINDDDLDCYLDAANRLPLLKMTVAPESVSFEQIKILAEKGILISLGHTDASFETCMAAAAAGARCVTHLFNAQSQLGNREPGVVGAALSIGAYSAGLIADTIHVHPATMTAALRAKTGPGRIFLVSDAMATAGSDIDTFSLNGRTIHRDDNRLTLANGTLAGAHLDLATAIRNVVQLCGIDIATAFAMATAIPAELAGLSSIRGTFCEGARADMLHVDEHLMLKQVWTA